MRSAGRRFFVLLILFTLLACQRSAAPPTEAHGQILLWHGWANREAEVLGELIAKFEAIYPNVSVVPSAVPADDLVKRFRVRAAMGLGPDLVILPGSAMLTLAEAELVQSLEGRELDTDSYLDAAVDALRYRGQLYGLPLSLQTMALYYNKELTTEPPATLDALLGQVNQGKQVIIYTDFYRAFWGIKAFGGKLFDDQGRAVLHQGGFANWLGWLKIAKNLNGIITTTDPQVGASLFQQGEIAYYVGQSTELHALQEALGEDAVGVAPLPAGPNGPAGPFLQVEALLLNGACSRDQTELALRLAQFLSNEEQQLALARRAGKIPASARVRIDPRIAPRVADFVAQTRTAVPIPNLPQMSDLLALGSDAYVQALEGVVNVAEAAQTLTEAVNAAHDLDTPSVDGATACELEGTVRVWHAWPNADTTGLRMIIQAFTRRCPGVHVDLVRVDDGALLAQYQDAIAQDQGPDLLLGSSAWVAELADEGLASPLTPLVGPDLLQRFRPEMLQALTYEEQLYGLPLALDVVALYQNTTLATETPRILDDLVALASPGQRVALPADFYHGFWGVAAHGGVSVGEGEDGELTLDAPGFVAWLEWLTAAQLTPGVVVDTETAALQRLFMDGGAAYWVGDASALYDVEAALGRDAVAVLPLPAGPVAEARPLLRVSGLLLNPTISQERAALAIAFATYMTNEESQARLMELLGHVPSNVSVSTAYRPAVAGFIEQAKQSLVPPDTVVRDELDEWGDALYAQALSTTKDLAELVEPFVRSFNAQTEAP